MVNYFATSAGCKEGSFSNHIWQPHRREFRWCLLTKSHGLKCAINYSILNSHKSFDFNNPCKRQDFSVKISFPKSSSVPESKSGTGFIIADCSSLKHKFCFHDFHHFLVSTVFCHSCQMFSRLGAYVAFGLRNVAFQYISKTNSIIWIWSTCLDHRRQFLVFQLC